MNILRENLGNLLRSLRRQRGLTIEQVATNCGLHSTHIGKIERGETSPSIEKLEQIVETYHITLEDLFSILEKNKYNEKYTHVEVSITSRVKTMSLEEKEKLLKFIELFFE
jgi:transcriptional regulator with XRE-family HTH domain